MKRAALALAAGTVLCLVFGGVLVRLVVGVTGSAACAFCVLALMSSAGAKLSVRRPKRAVRPPLVRYRVTSVPRDVRPACPEPPTRPLGDCTGCGHPATGRLDEIDFCGTCADDYRAMRKTDVFEGEPASADFDATVAPDGSVAVTEVRAWDNRPAGTIDMTEFENKIN